VASFAFLGFLGCCQVEKNTMRVEIAWKEGGNI